MSIHTYCYAPIPMGEIDLKAELKNHIVKGLKSQLSQMSSRTLADWKKELESDIYADSAVISDCMRYAELTRRECFGNYSLLKFYLSNLMENLGKSVEEYRDQVYQATVTKFSFAEHETVEDYFNKYDEEFPWLPCISGGLLLDRGHLYVDTCSQIFPEGKPAEFLFKREERFHNIFRLEIPRYENSPTLHSYEETKEFIRTFLERRPEYEGYRGYSREDLVGIIEGRNERVKRFWEVHPEGIITFI